MSKVANYSGRQAGSLGIVLHIGPLKLSNDGTSHFKFVIQSPFFWESATCLNRSFYDVLKVAEMLHQVVDFKKPINMKFMSLFKNSEITLSKSTEIQWNKCPTWPDCEEANVISILMVKSVNGDAV